MKKLILFVLVLTILLSACGGGGGTSTSATVYFTNGITSNCDYVSFDDGFTTLHWGPFSSSYPSSEIDHVVNE
jgi:hypothetical protein